MKHLFIAIILFSLPLIALEATIIELSGSVKIRRGMDEEWIGAARQMILRDIDTILTGENGSVVLSLDDERQFTLESNSILDIADLRDITQKELFLFLMRQKIEKLEKRSAPAQLKLGKVSVVHGAKSEDKVSLSTSEDLWTKESNGVNALFIHELYSNVVMKSISILRRYPDQHGCTDLYFKLASSFDALEKKEQAETNFRRALENAKTCGDENAIEEAKAALKKLKD
ncbi:MAG: hypothetical protein ACRBF0_03700 [Calditrichia bacterium]